MVFTVNGITIFLSDCKPYKSFYFRFAAGLFASLVYNFGNGLTVIFDGQNIKYTNIFDIKIGGAIAVENVCVHTLTKGHGYNMLTRKYMTPSEMGGF